MFKLKKWFTFFKNGSHLPKIKKAFWVKLKIFFIAPNTQKYKKHFLKIILLWSVTHIKRVFGKPPHIPPQIFIGHCSSDVMYVLHRTAGGFKVLRCPIPFLPIYPQHSSVPIKEAASLNYKT
jgi:hypothetical protein